MIFAVDAFVVFGALLLAVGNLIRLPRDVNAWLVAGILMCSVCAVVLARYQYGFWIPEAYRIDVGAWEPVLNVARNLGPALFMVLCHSLFQDTRRFPRWLLMLVVVQVLLEEPIHLIVRSDTSTHRLLTEAAPALLQAVFAGFAIYWTVAGWTQDLVETRRRMRVVVLAFIGVLMLGSVLLLRVIIPWNSIENYHANVVLNVLFALVIAAVLVSLLSTHDIEHYLNPGRTPALQADAVPAPRDDETAAAVRRLDELMDVEHAYRQPGLSIAGLAELMGLPEYRLRKLIHEELGYRNFNAFLHRYRIEEACRRLRDPAESRIPILTIGLSVGYQSINTFNRGFREVVGTTPSAYRASRAADDGGTPPDPPKPSRSLPDS